MKCIVTGATGHIGNVLVKQLFQKGYEVIAIVLPKDDCKMIEPYAEIVLGNILDVAFLETALKNVDFVFHLAGIVEIGSGKKQSIFKVNVEGTRNVVNACLKNHIKRLIYTSSVHAIPELPKTETMVEIDHFDPVLVKGNYGKSKAMATQIVMDQKDSDLEVVIVHPSGVLGPADYKLSNVSQMFIDFLCGRLTAYLKGGYNFVDVRDVARGIILAAEKGKRGECYILSGSEITVKELLDEISLISGRKRVKTKLAFWFILAMSYFAELYYKVVKQKPLFTHYSIVVLNSNYHFSNEKAKRELGFTTRDIKESIKDAMDFAVENYLTKKGTKFKVKSIE
ncbi:MAG: NAD-dependent epimerase/dehydratase family protein [Candidatus Izemoplasmatales bacterium]|jgi:dihydroflavonol-4-reductase|nr:NAD-dependent epimerase/dehydratase family protein [Candidatus Izemoplasmatales bacterium]MDD4596081.1 NAD-dependent epimerase/dehydratase family protein [Candidatus Izemoplasmatales bacterium]